jgi:hypothetical protein
MEPPKVNNRNTKIPKGAVLADAKKRREEYEASNAFIQNNVAFDPGFYLDKEYKDIAARLFNDLLLGQQGYKMQQKLFDFEILISNLLKQRKAISISLNRNNWKQTKHNKISYFIIELIRILKEKDLLGINPGYYTPHESRFTRIRATDKLLSYFPKTPSGVLWAPVQLVELRDGEDKLKDYKDTAETWRIRSILQRINEVNSKVDIRYHKHKLNAFLVAIFIERFTWYGRLHTRGFMHYQGLSKEERKDITINGDQTIELDYSGLHPNLLYAWEGIKRLEDPYSVVDKRPEARDFLKHMLICMINSKDKATAEKAANYWLLQHHTEREQLKEIGITCARPFIDKFFEVHQRIAHYFCKGKDTGMQIMNKDSKIALDIVDHFAKKNIPILAIHDSFIVQKQYRTELYEVMQNTYQNHTGFRIRIK